MCWYVSGVDDVSLDSDGKQLIEVVLPEGDNDEKLFMEQGVCACTCVFCVGKGHHMCMLVLIDLILLYDVYMCMSLLVSFLMFVSINCITLVVIYSLRVPPIPSL